LTYRFVFGPDFNIERNGRFTGSQTNSRRGGDATGSVAEEFRFNYTVENILTYNKTFKTNHNINLTALQSIQRDNLERTNVSVQGIPAPPPFSIIQ